MKALKEKRISLRSLWRRGLVILSLFALVFVSCSDSSGSTDETTATGPYPISVEIYNGSLGTQYEGTYFDMKAGNISARVVYSDNTTKEFKASVSHQV